MGNKKGQKKVGGMEESLSMERPRLEFTEPLANLMRPQTLGEFFGQEELIGRGRALSKLIEQDQLHSMIFFGPPGVGKTTLAQIIAAKTESRFVTISAVTAGVPELRKVIDEAEEYLRLGNKTILFVDEIHRFNKSQQDFLLPHTERGTITLIGATTENPSFEVNSALLSRAQVFVFKALNEQALLGIIDKVLEKIRVRQVTPGGISEEQSGGVGGGREKKPTPFQNLNLTEEAKDWLVAFANGDARNLLNNLELVLKVAEKWPVDLEELQRVLQKKSLRYDKKGEEHYNIISALHKSLRDSDVDGALYWMMRMLAGGEDPMYLARRLVRFASEDIGMADPHALLVAVAAKDACHFIGMPECEVNLAQVVVHLAMAPKSNSLYKAIGEVKRVIAETGNLEVPLEIRNAPTKLMKQWGYGKGYKYAHDYEGAVVDQQHLPDQLVGKRFYFPVERGVEAKIKERLDKKMGSN